MYNNSAFIDFKLEKAVKQNPFAPLLLLKKKSHVYVLTLVLNVHTGKKFKHLISQTIST